MIGFLGSGGFGQVYVARPDSRPRELVAIKVLRPDRTQDQRFRRRFEREINAMAAVSSEYVPRLIRQGNQDGLLWYASELIQGPTLHDVVTRRGPLPPEAVWHLGLGLIGALEAIQPAVDAHRDLKPANILLVREGPRLIDFGIALPTAEGHGTSSEVGMGADGYAAPEQIGGLRDAAKEADVFALGATLLFAATGHGAYAGWADGLNGRVNKTGLPDVLYGVVSSCLYKEKSARPTLGELRAEFPAPVRAAAGPRAFGAVLPAGTMDVIREWRDELGKVIAAASSVPQGDAMPDGRHASPNDTKRIAHDPTSLIDGSRPPGGTLIYPGTAPAPVSSPAARNVRWQQAFGDWVRAPVAAAYRAVLAGSLDGTVACLDAENGEVISSLSLGAAVRWVAILTGGEYACAADADGGMHAIALRTGQASSPRYAPGGFAGTPVEADGQLYTVSGSGVVYEIDKSSGDHKRLCDLREPALGALAVAHGVLFSAGARGISAIDIASGTVRWQIDSPARVYSAPVTGNGRLYFAQTDGVLCSVSADTGRSQEQVGTGAPVHKAIAYDTDLGLLYVPGADGHLRAFDISGPHAVRPALVWQRRVGEEIGGVTAAYGIAHCTVDGTVTGLDGDGGGRSRYRVAVGGTLTAPPTLYGQPGYGQVVYVGGLDGAVSCVTMS